MPPVVGKNKKKESSPAENKVQFVSGYLFTKELQRCISFKAYEYVCCQGKGLKRSQQHDLAYKKYHGMSNDDSIGLAEKFMKGIEMFGGIYDASPDPVTGSVQKVLKPVLHCTGHKIVSDPNKELKGINMTTLTSTKKSDLTLISGRAIIEMGKKVEENGRKVMSIVLRSSKYSNKKLPSGEEWEDYLRYCRYKMALLLGTKQSGDDDDDDQFSPPIIDLPTSSADADDADTEAQKIKDWNSSWIWQGYMAWALWGHLMIPGMPEEFKSKMFMTGDESSETKSGANSRKSSRKEQAKEESKERMNAGGVAADGRGIPAIKEIFSNHVRNSERFYIQMEDATDTEQLFNCINKRIDEANRSIMEVSQIVYSRPECFDNPEGHMNWYPFRRYWESVKARDSAMAELKELEDEIAQARKEKKEARKKRKHVATDSSPGDESVEPSQAVGSIPSHVGCEETNMMLTETTTKNMDTSSTSEDEDNLSSSRPSS